jgi:hypothetical protein
MQMISGYAVLNVILIAMLLWSRAVLQRFLREHASITDSAVLAEFKSIARWNMYGALAYVVAGVVVVLWGILLALLYGLLGIAVVLAFSVPSVFIGLNAKKVETRARAMDCADPALTMEYMHVCEVWVKKALPDF